MNEKAIYTCVDQEHNTWQCSQCGRLETFEADGPVENGWNFCPDCGELVEQNATACPFDNANCMCQSCEEPCNNGMNCSDCRYEGRVAHNVYLCTGFSGNIDEHIRNWAKAYLRRREASDNDLV